LGGHQVESGRQFKGGKHLSYTEIAAGSSSYEIPSRTSWVLPLWITEGDLVAVASETARSKPVELEI